MAEPTQVGGGVSIPERAPRRVPGATGTTRRERERALHARQRETYGGIPGGKRGTRFHRRIDRAGLD